MFRTFFLILFSTVATVTSAQQSPDIKVLSGKTFVSGRLEYLKIINDSTLISSINSYNDSASFFLQNNTFHIKEQYLQTDQTGTKWIGQVYDYQLIKLAPDTLALKNRYRPVYNREDTLVFVNIERIKEPVSDFKYLKLDCAGAWSGARYIVIDSLGSVLFVDEPIPYSIHNPRGDKNAKPRELKGKLTPKEFANFKSLLSKSLPSKLPLVRDCAMDDSRFNFEILIGKRKIRSVGCNLSWTHVYLVNYLYDLDKNKGFVKMKRQKS